MQQPEASHGGERHGEQHDARLHCRPEVEVEEDNDDQQGEGQHQAEPLGDALHGLVLPGPLEVVAGGKLHFPVHGGLGIGYVAPDISVANVHEDPAAERAVLVPDDRRTSGDMDVGQLGQRHLRARWRRDQHPHQLVDIVSQLSWIADVDGVPFSPLHGGVDVHPADRRLHHGQHVLHAQAVARGVHSARDDIHKRPSGHALRVDVLGAGHRAEHGLEVLSDALYGIQIGAEDLDAYGRANPGCQHVDAGFDGPLEPALGDPWQVEGMLHLLQQARPRHTLPPFGLRLHHDGGFDHAQRRGVGGRLRAADLPEDTLHFGEGADDSILYLEQPAGLGGGNARHSYRHVEDVALVEFGHELAPQLEVAGIAKGQHGAEQYQHSNEHGGAAMVEHESHYRVVSPDEETSGRILVFGSNAAADEPHHEDGNQRHGDECGEEHGEGLREGERLEESALLGLEREDRHEGDGDDEEGEEERPAHLLGGTHNDP